MKTKLKRAFATSLVVMLMLGVIGTQDWIDLFGFVATVNANETNNPYSSDYGLDQLSVEQKDSYDKLKEAAEQTVKSDYTTRTMCSGKYIFTSLTVPYALTEDETAEVLAFFYWNNPIYYWSTCNAVMYGEKATTILLLSDEKYGTKYKTLYNQMENEIKDRLTAIAGISDDYRKAKILHDNLAEEVSYLYEEDGITPSKETFTHGVDGVFINKEAVCEGYAKAYALLLNAAGIENCFVLGHSGATYTDVTSHVWNGVKINEKWYYADVTWDDGDPIKHNWFLYGQDYHDTQDKHIGGSDNTIYDLPMFESNYCNGEDGEVTKYKISSPNYSKIKVYNQGILLDINNGMDVEEGTILTVKMADLVTRPTFYVNGSVISEDSFAVTANSVITYTLETVNVTGLIVPLPEQTIEIAHREDEDNYPYGPYGAKNNNFSPYRGELTYITDRGNIKLSFYWKSDNFTSGTGRKEYDVYTDLYNVPSYINIPDEYKRLTYHIIEGGSSVQLGIENPSASAKLIMKDAKGTEYSNGSYIEIGTEVTLSVVEEGTQRNAAFAYTNGSEGASPVTISGNTFIITDSSVKFSAQLQTTTLTGIDSIATEYDVLNGTTAMPSLLGLPNEVFAHTQSGDVMLLLQWNLAAYDATDASQHDVTVSAIPIIPSYITDSSHLATPVNVTLHVSKGHVISQVNQDFPSTLEVPAGTPRNAQSLGLPTEASCASDETGSVFTAKVKWEAKGTGSNYTMVGTIARTGYIYELPITVTVNETEGFTAIPNARLEFHSGNTDKQPIYSLNQASKDEFMVTAYIQPMESHTNRVLSVIIPDGITLVSYADVSQLQNIDTASATIQEDGSTVVRIEIADALIDSSLISFQMLVSLNFSTQSLMDNNQNKHDFGMIYEMGEEVPFAIQYEAQENGIDRSMFVDPQNVIKVRDDYDLSTDGSGIMTVHSLQMEGLYEDLRENYDFSSFDFYENVDMPYFTSVQAYIPLPGVMKDVVLGVKKPLLSCVDNALGYKELRLTVNSPYYIYTSRQEDAINGIVNSASTNMPDLEAGRNYKAEEGIVYIFTDNFGNQYRFDTGIYNAVITKPSLSVDTAKLGAGVSAQPIMEYTTQKIALPSIMNTAESFDFSVRDAQQVKIKIDVPDSVSVSQMTYAKKPTSMKVYFSNGVSKDVALDTFEADIPAPDAGCVITKIEFIYANIGETQGLSLGIMVTANETRQDGSNVVFGTHYEVKDNQVITDCDTDEFSITMSYTGIRNHTESKKVPVYFKLMDSSSKLVTDIAAVEIQALNNDVVTKSTFWKVANNSIASAIGNQSRHNVTAELKIPENNTEIIQITGLSAGSGNIKLSNQNYTYTVYYTDGSNENITIGNNGTFSWKASAGKIVDKVLFYAEEMRTDEKANLSVTYQIDSAKFIEKYGFQDPNALYIADGIRIYALQSSLNAQELNLENDCLFAYGNLNIVTTFNVKSAVITKAVENTVHTLTNQMIQTDIVSTTATFETKYYNDSLGSILSALDSPNIPLNCSQLEVKLGLNEYLDYQENSAVLQCNGNEYHVASQRQEGSNLFLTFNNVIILTKDGSYGKSGYPFTVTIDTKPYFNAIGGNEYTNIRINNYSCELTLDNTQSADTLYPYMKFVSQTMFSGATGDKSGNLTILQAQVERLDNYGKTTERSETDYGPYLVNENQDFTYNIFTFAESNQPMRNITQYVIIPRMGTVVKTQDGEEKESAFDTVLKDIEIQTTKTDCDYQIYYTTDAVKSDNSEIYLPYNNNSLTAEEKEEITKVKITSAKSYWGDIIALTLSHPTGGNKKVGMISTYLASSYEYTGILASSATRGNTPAVEYKLDNRAQFGWTVSTQNILFPTETENQQTAQAVNVTVTNTGTQPIDNITVSGCEDWLIVSAPQRISSGFTFDVVTKTGLPIGSKLGTLVITANNVPALSNLSVDVNKTIQSPVITPPIVEPTSESSSQPPVNPTTPSNPTITGNQSGNAASTGNINAISATQEQPASTQESISVIQNPLFGGIMPGTGDVFGVGFIVLAAAAFISFLIIIYCRILTRKEEDTEENKDRNIEK